MKFVNHVKYHSEKVEGLRPVRWRYAARLPADRKLVVAGSFSDGSGALFINEVKTFEEAEAW
jgi:hypothetical protein